MKRKLELGEKVGVVIAIAFVGLGWVSITLESLEVENELQVWAPSKVCSGQLPVKARLIRDKRGQLDTVPFVIDYKLNHWGQPIEGRLGSAFQLAVVGNIPIPPTIQPRFVQLELVAKGSKNEVITAVTHEVQVGERCEEELISHGAGLAWGNLGLRYTQEKWLMHQIGVVVEGGACVPEHPCRIWVRFDGDASRLELRNCMAVDSVEKMEQSPLVGFGFLMNGMENACDLFLGDECIGQLTFPVGLAMPWFEWNTEEKARGDPPIGFREAYLDGYFGNEWVFVTTMKEGEEAPLPWPRLPQKRGMVLRVVARGSLGGDGPSFVRVKSLGDKNEAYKLLSTLLGVHGSGEGVAMEGDIEASLFWLERKLEALVPAPVVPISSREKDELELRRFKDRMRLWSRTAWVFGMVALVGWIGWVHQDRRVVRSAQGASSGSVMRRICFAWLLVGWIGLVITLGAMVLLGWPWVLGSAHAS
ncbi:MAG: hypothetical protein NZM37_09375 [Sandaracinaceae bacterium]|nr:hypothetical protein [Sandaracinaceae bacterium]